MDHRNERPIRPPLPPPHILRGMRPPPPIPGLPPPPQLPFGNPADDGNKREWAMFKAPLNPSSYHMPGEIYYFERVNGISTWIRPFDYAEPPLEEIPRIEEQWKQEEMERLRQSARRKAKQDKPVKQTPVPGSQWTRVDTAQGRVYYYNSDTKESMWNVTPDLAEILRNNQTGTNEPSENNEDGNEEKALDEMEGTEMNADDAEWMLAQMDEDIDDLQSDNNDADYEIAGQSIHLDSGPGRSQESTKEDRVLSFKTMLREANINPFSTWELELPKFETDTRLAEIESSSERKDLFDIVCKDLVQERRQQKTGGKPKGSGDPFDQLLEDKVKSKMTFAKFCQIARKDPRFLKLRSSREREKRFKSFIKNQF